MSNNWKDFYNKQEKYLPDKGLDEGIGIGKQLSTEQLLKIVGEGSYDLGFHEGQSNVLIKLKEAIKMCEDEGEPWKLEASGELEKWAKEEFNIDIK